MAVSRTEGAPRSLALQLERPLSWLVVAGVLALLFFFLVWPVAKIISKAFIGPEGFTWAYFGLLFANPLNTAALLNSLWIGLAVTFLCAVISFPLAVINSRYEYRGKAFLSGLLLVPMVLPPFVGAIGIQRFFARFGSVNQILLQWGWIERPIDWLGTDYALWAVILLTVLHLYPIMYLNLSAALANIDPSLEEMATLTGSSRWRLYKDVVWPLARPGFFAGALIVFIWAYTDLGTPLLVGLHETVPVYIFNMVTDAHENPVGFALVFLVIVGTLICFGLSKLSMKAKKFEMMNRGHVSSRITRARWMHIPIYLAILGVVLPALVPHIGVVITSIADRWFLTPLPDSVTMAHYQSVFGQSLAFTGIKNSLLFAGLATVFDLVMGVVIAYIVARKKIPFADALDGLVMIPLALPGIVIAFGYVVTYSGTWLDPMMDPSILIVIAYAIRRMPFMVRSAAAGLQQTSASLEEASLTLGATYWHTLRRITIPLVAANLVAGALLCFSYAMLDVSDSLILAMKDQFYPITKAIYALYLEQGTGEFVASALGVVAMGILSACILGASLILGKKMGELFRA